MYPKAGKGDLFERLVKQCKSYDIETVEVFPAEFTSGIIVDAIFGFSFKPPVRPSFMGLLKSIKNSGLPIVSIDIPSGWIVDEGPPESGDESTLLLEPDCLISLTAPKKCARRFTGRFHWLGGRFVPDAMQARYKLSLPTYQGTENCVQLK